MVDFKKASLAGKIIDDVIERLDKEKEFSRLLDVYKDLDEMDELKRDLKALAYRHLIKQEN